MIVMILMIKKSAQNQDNQHYLRSILYWQVNVFLLADLTSKTRTNKIKTKILPIFPNENSL